MTLVSRYKTPATEAEMRSALGRHFSGNRLAFTMAQTYLETAGWNAIYNYNVGNLAASTNYPGDSYPAFWSTVDANSSERYKKLNAQMLQGKAPAAFRSYNSLAEGVAAYAERMQNRFPEILTAADSGDPQAVANAIMVKYCSVNDDGGPCFGPAETKSLGDLAARFGGEVRAPSTRRFGFGTLLALGAVGGLGVLWWLGRQPSNRQPTKQSEEPMERQYT